MIHAHVRSHDPNGVKIAKSCSALIFFGVPNLGLQHDELISIVEGQPNEVLIRDPVVDPYSSEPSPLMKRISSQFSEHYKHLRYVVLYFETQQSPTVEVERPSRLLTKLILTHPAKIQPDGSLSRTGPLKFLVTEKSATNVGLTAEVNEYNIPLNRDHSSLVKFEDRGQEEYKMVMTKIAEFVRASYGGLEPWCT